MGTTLRARIEAAEARCFRAARALDGLPTSVSAFATESLTAESEHVAALSDLARLEALKAGGA